tara:strand:+ start:273 stop:734 length:462 start_codon:yes stop_codon:yes gene_type:complete
VVGVVEQTMVKMQEEMVALEVGVRTVEEQELVILHPLIQHKAKMVEQVLEHLLQVGVQLEAVGLFVQVKLLKVQMEVLVVMEVDYLSLLVLMVFLVGVIDIMLVVAEVELVIRVDHNQQVLVEKVVAVLVNQERVVQLQEMQELQIVVVAEVE